MKTWFKAILGGVAGASFGALLGLAGLACFFWLSPPTFKNDSEAMGFSIILITFGILVGGAGAAVGACLGSAIICWRAGRHKITGAVLSSGGVLLTCFLHELLVAAVLLLLAIALAIWDLTTKRETEIQPP